MNSVEIFNHIASLEATCITLRSELEQRRIDTISATKFYAVTMTSEEVAKFHGVSVARVRDYASRGLIELHPNSTDAKMLFRASSILTLSFDDLKRAKLILKR